MASATLLDAAARQVRAGSSGDALTSQMGRERNRLAAQMAQRNEEARRSHELGSALAGLGRGEGFVFNLARGLEIGLEANPDTSSIVDAKILALTPSVTIGALRENELSVHADGQGGFMVAMNAETTGSINFGLEFSLGTFALNAPDEEAGEEDPAIALEARIAGATVNAGYERGSASGIMLHFSSAEDCRSFLTDFMNPSSSLRSKDGGGSLWLTCDRLFTVQGGHVTRSFSMGASLGTLEAACIFAKASVSGPSVSFEASR